MDGPVLLRRHVFHADSTRIPETGLWNFAGEEADESSHGEGLRPVRGDPPRKRRFQITLRKAGLSKTLPNRACRVQTSPAWGDGGKCRCR